MSAVLHEALQWWRGGDLLMPVMFLVAVVLYAILAERTLVLWGLRQRQRTDDVLSVMRDHHAAAGDQRWRTFAAQYVGLSEAEQLSRGFALTRALTTCLPLLGLMGTVTGMIATFGHLGVVGGRGGMIAGQASAGIGLALTATQYGMALAIPAVVWDWMLARRAAAIALHRELVVRGAQDVDEQEGSA